jgi:hypothetical protein
MLIKEEQTPCIRGLRHLYRREKRRRNSLFWKLYRA